MGCQPDLNPVLVAQFDGLDVTANISKVSFDFRDNPVTYFADVRVTNTSQAAKEYSNSWLWLELHNGQRVQTYSDSVASQHIDVAPLKVEPDETLELQVYWVLSGEDFDKEGNYPFELVLAPDT